MARSQNREILVNLGNAALELSGHGTNHTAHRTTCADPDPTFRIGRKMADYSEYQFET